jgi:hypothetical protein
MNLYLCCCEGLLRSLVQDARDAVPGTFTPSRPSESGALLVLLLRSVYVRMRLIQLPARY